MEKNDKVIAKRVLLPAFLMFISVCFYTNGMEAANSTSHFTSVWQGENGQNHMNFMVVSAVLDELPLSVDDEIAVFSGSLCVGAASLSIEINPADNTTFLLFTASQSDGADNGFLENDSVIFKFWDNASQKEMIVSAIIYRNDISSWLTTGKFSAGATSVVELTSLTEVVQTIELIKGTNLFSTYIKPTKPQMSDILKSVFDQGYLIKVQDELGNTWEMSKRTREWTNNIGNLENTEAYVISLTTNCTVQVSGRKLVLPFDIPLNSGWNFISFPQTSVADGMQIVQSLIDQNVLVKVQDELGNTIENMRKYGGWRNTIGNFVPGKGYKVNVSSNAVLTIQ
ncbi:MAG: hypothetical protein WAO52_12100 [Prolixibacteraceae bacterium]